jgi:hypothetical protein
MFFYTTINGAPTGAASKPFASRASADSYAAEQNGRAKALGLSAVYGVAECQKVTDIGHKGKALP